MEFEKREQHGKSHHFSGIYKITSYEYFKGSWVKPYYRAYYLEHGDMNWGMGVSRDKSERLTLKQAQEQCRIFAETYEPTPRQIKRAAIVTATFN